MPTKGSFEEMHNFLLENDLYEQWRSVFDEYVELATSGDSEALKRAIFFLWYETCEPYQLSGLLDLNRTKVIKTVECLNAQLGSGATDEELIWMLPYYYQISDWYLPKEASSELILAVSKENINAWQKSLSKDNFNNRGQLGVYWQSIQL